MSADYCTCCGFPVTGEPLIPDRGMRLCWLCAEAPLLVPRERIEFVQDYSGGHLEAASVRRARLEAEALMSQMPEAWRERRERARERMRAA